MPRPPPRVAPATSAIMIPWRQRASACPDMMYRMAKRRDIRRPGPGPYLLGLRGDRAPESDRGFPFNVPAVQQIEALSLDQPITLLAGENGSGKSTLIEAFAEAIGFAPEGGE